MADALTPNYGFTKPEVGASDDTWGGKLNANWASLDTLLKSSNDNINLKVNKSGDTMTGQLTLTGVGNSVTPHLLIAPSAAGPAVLVLRKNGASAYAIIHGQTSTGLGRMSIALTDAAGTDDLQVLRYNDAGTFVDFPLVINRATGIVNMPLGATSGMFTMTGPLTIAPAAGSPTLTLNAIAGSQNWILGQKAGKHRWLMYLGHAGAESGANAGSDFYLFKYADDGTTSASVLDVNRATGIVNMPLGANIAATTASTSPTTGALVVAGGLGVGGAAQVTGNVSSGGFILSGQGTYISLHASAAIFGMQSGVAGTVYLRPNGYDSGVGQLVVFSTGVATITGVLNPYYILDKTAAGGSSTLSGRMAGKSRWGIALGDAAAESGSNAGSDFQIYRYDDAGAYLGAAITINRATGGMTTGGAMNVGGNVTANGQAFIGAANVVILGTNTGGTGQLIYLRPTAYNSNVGEVRVGPSQTFFPYPFEIATFTSVAPWTVGAFYYNSAVIYSSTSTTSSYQWQRYYNPNGLVGYIQSSASATAYSTTSDEHLKEFNAEYDPQEAIAIIRADPVLGFTWKSTGEEAIGWFARKSHAIDPNLAVEPGPTANKDGTFMALRKDAKPGDEDFVPWGIDYGKRTPYLWAALSNVLDRLEALETKLTGEAPKPMRKKAA